jgi:hypothetical protein
LRFITKLSISAYLFTFVLLKSLLWCVCSFSHSLFCFTRWVCAFFSLHTEFRSNSLSFKWDLKSFPFRGEFCIKKFKKKIRKISLTIIPRWKGSWSVIVSFKILVNKKYLFNLDHLMREKVRISGFSGTRRIVRFSFKLLARVSSSSRNVWVWLCMSVCKTHFDETVSVFRRKWVGKIAENVDITFLLCCPSHLV